MEVSEEEKEARDILVNEIADILVGEYCTHCKICENEDIECRYIKAINIIDELIDKQQKLTNQLLEDMKERANNFSYESEIMWRKIEKAEELLKEKQ